MNRSGKRVSKPRRTARPKSRGDRECSTRAVNDIADPTGRAPVIESGGSEHAEFPPTAQTDDKPLTASTVDNGQVTPSGVAQPSAALAPESARGESSRRVEEFLGFRLDNEEYGVWIRSVREIIRPTEITPIPRSPADILGIISLRGTIVPIFDVRRRLGLPPRIVEPKSRIIVIVRDGAPVGMVVDHVTEVIIVDPEALEPPPPTMGEHEASVVTATLRHQERLIGVLHLERLVAIEPVAPLRTVA